MSGHYNKYQELFRSMVEASNKKAVGGGSSINADSSKKTSSRQNMMKSGSKNGGSKKTKSFMLNEDEQIVFDLIRNCPENIIISN